MENYILVKIQITRMRRVIRKIEEIQTQPNTFKVTISDHYKSVTEAKNDVLPLRFYRQSKTLQRGSLLTQMRKTTTVSVGYGCVIRNRKEEGRKGRRGGGKDGRRERRKDRNTQIVTLILTNLITCVEKCYRTNGMKVFTDENQYLKVTVFKI